MVDVVFDGMGGFGKPGLAGQRWRVDQEALEFQSDSGRIAVTY